jgi:hypothetical protein
MKIETTKIPDGCINFAKELAESATKHGIKSFSTKLTLDSDIHGFDGSFRGDLTIHFSSKDGRGRPCDNLSIRVETTLIKNIVSTPESCS